MCPQLLSRVNASASVEFGYDALTKRPELGNLIGQVITTWSYCDAAFTAMLTHFLHADFQVVHEMYHALRSTDARRQMLQAAAEETLDTEDLLIFNAVKKCTNASRTKRNDFAHNLWGTSSEIPDALLMSRPRIISEYEVYEARMTSGRPENVTELVIRFGKNFDKIYVYRKNDLSKEVAEAHWSWLHINALRDYVSRSVEEEREIVRNALLAEPRIQECVANLSP